MEPSEGLTVIMTGMAKNSCISVEICNHTHAPTHPLTHTHTHKLQNGANVYANRLKKRKKNMFTFDISNLYSGCSPILVEIT